MHVMSRETLMTMVEPRVKRGQEQSVGGSSLLVVHFSCGCCFSCGGGSC